MSTTDIIKQLGIFSKQNEGTISSLKSKNVELNYDGLDIEKDTKAF